MVSSGGPISAPVSSGACGSRRGSTGLGPSPNAGILRPATVARRQPRREPQTAASSACLALSYSLLQRLLHRDNPRSDAVGFPSTVAAVPPSMSGGSVEESPRPGTRAVCATSLEARELREDRVRSPPGFPL